MKPGQLKRKKPLARSQKPMKKTRLRPVSDARRKVLRKREGLRAALRERSEGLCEMPGGHIEGCPGYGQDPAHILPSSLGGDDLDINEHLWLSRICHDWCENNPAAARERGANRGRYK